MAGLGRDKNPAIGRDFAAGAAAKNTLEFLTVFAAYIACWNMAEILSSLLMRRMASASIGANER